MRIILDSAIGWCPTDTIVITDDELNKIFGGFIVDEVVMAGFIGAGNTLRFETREGITFAEYFKLLIELARTK